MDLFKRPVVILIIVGAVVIAMLWSYFSKVSEQKKAEQLAAESAEQAKSALVNLTTVDASEFDEFVRNEFAEAKNLALQADPKHKVVAIEAIMPSLAISSGDTRYIFASEDDPLNNWTITFSQASSNYIRAEIPKDDYLGELPPMDTTQWKFNYVTAIQIMERAGGKDWREINGLSGAEVALRQSSASEPLSWTVTYSSGRESISKTINANDGKIIE